MKDFDGKDTKNCQTSAADAVSAALIFANAFAGKSEKDVWQAIYSQAEKGKREGSLTDGDLDNFYNALAPFLDSFKRQKLKSIILRLKNI